MDTDRNLLFGVLALQSQMIDAPRFAEACAAWSARKGQPLADLLVERGWLSADDRALIDRLLERTLAKHGGNAHESLADAAAGLGAAVGHVCQTVADPDVRASLADLDLPGTAPGHGTVEYVAPLGQGQARDRYSLTTMHAKGGIGQVWLARDTELDREVALKELRPEQSGNATVLRRFLQEAKVTGQLDHPGVVPIYEVARGGGRGPGGRPYYTMRFIRGKTLTDAVRDYHEKREAGKARRTDLLTLVQAFQGVCNTVAYAHSKGVIHRDLKGLNIVLGEFGEVVLLDWGLAKLVDQPAAPEDEQDDPQATGAWSGASADPGLTVAGQAMGTPAFMAPEQAEGRLDRIGRRTDVYGLGAILYEVLAGRAPFDGQSTQEVLRKVREVSPDRPRKFWPKAPRALEAVCLKALAKDPGDRYASAAELAEDVRHWLADEPVLAYREPWAARARRWVGRNKTLVASGAAALVVAVVGLAALAVAQERSRSELAAALERAEHARTEAGSQADLATQAIAAFTEGVSRDVILARPELDGLRRRLLGAALDFYQKQQRLLEAQSAVVTMSETNRLVSLARSLDQIAGLQSQIGDKEAAIATRRKVVEIYDALPGSAGPPAAAEAVMNLGNLQRMAGRPDEALRSLRDAVARFDRLNFGRQHDNYVAQSLLSLGMLLKDSAVGEAGEGRRTLERAREVFGELAGDNPRAYSRRNLAEVECALGTLDDFEGRTAAALGHYEQAYTIFNDFLALSPRNSYFRAEVARSLNNLGLTRARGGGVDQGRRDLERGREMREALLAEEPLNIERRSDLARSHFHLACLEQIAGRPAEALASVDRAEAQYAGVPPKSVEDIYFQASLKALRAALIGPGKAEVDLTPAERDARRRAADEAMELLKKAVAGGYGNSSILKNDRRLDALRSRPDFQEILRSLGPKPPAPAARP